MQLLLAETFSRLRVRAVHSGGDREQNRERYAVGRLGPITEIPVRRNL